MVVDGAAIPDIVQQCDDFRIDPVGIVGPKAEAHDVELHRREQFEFWFGRDLRFQAARQRAGPADHRAELFGAVGFLREPRLQRAKAAGHPGRSRMATANPLQARAFPGADRLPAPQMCGGAVRRREREGSPRRRAPVPICGNRKQWSRRLHSRRGEAQSPATRPRARRMRRRYAAIISRRGTRHAAPQNRRSLRHRLFPPTRSREMVQVRGAIDADLRTQRIGIDAMTAINRSRRRASVPKPARSMACAMQPCVATDV